MSSVPPLATLEIRITAIIIHLPGDQVGRCATDTPYEPNAPAYPSVKCDLPSIDASGPDVESTKRRPPPQSARTGPRNLEFDLAKPP